MENLHNFANVVIASEVSAPVHLQVRYKNITVQCLDDFDLYF